jgi:tetratricopeptide (TPR) repeat protein
MKANVLLLCIYSLFAVSNLHAQPSQALPVPSIKLAPPEPPAPDFGKPLARAMDEGGAGDYLNAIADAKESLALAEQQLGPDDDTVAHIAHILATYHLMAHQDDSARALLGRELRIEHKPDGPKDVDLNIAKILTESAHTLEFADTPNAEKAAELLQRALVINEQTYGSNSSFAAANVFELAGNLVLQGKFAQAEPLYKRALAIFEKDPIAQTNVLVVLNDLASMYMTQKRYPEAEPLLKRALATAQANLDPGSSLLGQIREHLAMLYLETGRRAAADAMSTSENRR